MNKLFRDVLIARAEYLSSRSNSILKLKHSGTEGDLRELFLHDLLIPLLPPNLVTVHSPPVCRPMEQVAVVG
jgi:hypothetical protein